MCATALNSLPEELFGEYVADQAYATYFSDPAGGRLMEDFGQDIFTWSNAYLHAASTWPHSRDVIARSLGHLPKDILKKVVREKCNQALRPEDRQDQH